MGLLDQAVTDTTKVKTYDPAMAKMTGVSSTGYTPEGVNVTPKSTVQAQVNEITSSGSPLMQQAERRANQASNARGLLNSSIAVGAAQDAVIQNALPIAQQDASTYHDANVRTVDAKNAAYNFGAAASNQAELARAQLTTDLEKSNAAAKNQALSEGAAAANNTSLANLDATTKQSMQGLDLASRERIASMDNASREKLGLLDAATRKEISYLDANTKLQLQHLDNATRVQLADMDNTYRQLLQANQSAANAYQQTVNNIANISIQPNLTMESKNNAIATQLNSLREQLALTNEITTRNTQTVTSLNLGQYFDNYSMTQDTGNVARTTFGQNNTAVAPQAPGTDPRYAPQYFNGPQPSPQVPREFDDAMTDFQNGGTLTPANLQIMYSYFNKAKAGDLNAQRYFEEHGLEWNTPQPNWTLPPLQNFTA